MGHRLSDGGLGDGVEYHPLHGRALDGLLAVQGFQNMPTDRLALAVRVGGQYQAVGTLQGVGDVIEPLGRFWVDIPEHGEVVLGVHRAVLARQIAHMAVTRQDREVGPQVLVYGLGLGRALDNDDCVHAVRGALKHLGARGWRPPGRRKMGVTLPVCQRWQTVLLKGYAAWT